MKLLDTQINNEIKTKISLKNSPIRKIVPSSTCTKINKVRKTNAKPENEKSDNDYIIEILDKSDIMGKKWFV